MKKSEKYAIVQIPISALIIWFGGGLLYGVLEMQRFIHPMLWQSILAFLMIIYIFVSFEAAKRIGIKTIHAWDDAGSWFPTVCPGCRRELHVESKLKPLQIRYSCLTPGCQLATKKTKLKKKKQA